MRNLTVLIVCIFTFPLFTIAQLPAGSIAKYQLDNTAVDISGNGYNGTLSATAATTNRFATGNSATAFTAGSSTGSFPLALETAISNDFTLGYWFKTSMVANSSSQWYGGNAMVDAEVCGATSDWGTALIDGGKVCMGIGNPDLTIKSTATYNNGIWHFVTATRNEAAATIILYVDGVQVATTSGTTTVALTAPAFIGLGRNPCSASAVYTGSLDDVILYNRVLSGVEVGNLYNFYNGAVLPLHWISWNAVVSGNHTYLKWETEKTINNDHFEIQRSADGINFSIIGTVAAGNDVNTFTDASPVTGNNFYHIRQVDKDGKYSWSTIVKVSFQAKPSGVYLQTNPVAGELVLVNSGQILIQRVQVTDISGRVVIDQPLYSNNAIIKVPAQKLRVGYYLLKISTPESNTTIRLVKQ